MQETVSVKKHHEANHREASYASAKKPCLRFSVNKKQI